MKRKTGIWVILVAIIGFSIVIGTYYFMTILSTPKSPTRLVIATTTSLYDTGLLDNLEDAFQTEYSFKLYFISMGTGLAINHAKRGDADMILVHAPPMEFTFLEEGYGVCRKIIAYNFFTIIGPIDDTVQIANLSPIEALTKLVEIGRQGKTTWVSRGDDSGTHSKEKELWTLSGFNWEDLKEESWYMESGSGMGKTLLITNEFRGYTLSDMGTYLKYSAEDLIDLGMLVKSGKELLNVYSAIAVNPEANLKTNFEGALTFIKFLISEEGQQLISEYGKNIYPETLFYPAVKLLKTQYDPTLVSWIEDFAYFNGAECPPEYRDAHPELYE